MGVSWKFLEKSEPLKRFFILRKEKVDQIEFFSFGKATSHGESKLLTQTSFTPLKKLTLCHILLAAEGLGKYIYQS